MTRPESPRDPFMGLPPGAAGTDRRAFEILEEWHWPDTLRPGQQLEVSEDPFAPRAVGLFPPHHFRLADGTCTDCSSPPAALWYFRDEVIAVPQPGLPVTGVDDSALTAGIGDKAATGAWEASPAARYPSLVWIGAPEIIKHARLSADGRSLTKDGAVQSLALTPKIPLNESYADASTARFFSERAVTLRGAFHTGGRGGFVARTIWPEDWSIDIDRLALEPLGKHEMLGTLIEAQADASAEPLPARLLYERRPAGERSWAGKAVVAMVLSGAQSDDDGARAGHLGIATGVVGPRGEWHHWLVQNFYPLEANPKGIISASLPIDNYLLDLNSGQLYYRPGYMLVAVLSRPEAAAEIQSAQQQTMLDYYCRRFEFDLATHNSTAMSIDDLRKLGWRIPPAGATSRVLGALGAPIAAVANLSFASGRNFFKTMSAEKTRLLPRVAFEVAGHDLLYLLYANGDSGGLTRFEQLLADDVEALLFLRLPQVPSERGFGSYPARSLVTYGAHVFTSPSEYKSAPEGEPLEMPAELKRSCDSVARPRN